MSKIPVFTGACTAIITPFGENGIDYERLKKQLDVQYENGTAAVVVCGTTGENAVLTSNEHEELVRQTVRLVNGRMKVIAGVGSNNTLTALRHAEDAKFAGADAILMVTPYYNKTTQRGLIAHYTAIAEEGSLPVIVYNVPSRTGLNLEPKTLQTLSALDNIVAVKEASGNVIQVMDMMRLCGDNIVFYCGSDELTAPMLALGAKGVISVVSNIAPALMSRMTHGGISEAVETNLRLLPLIHALFAETSPAPVKYAASKMGLCENEVRLPLIPVSPETEAAINQEIQRLELC